MNNLEKLVRGIGKKAKKRYENWTIDLATARAERKAAKGLERRKNFNIPFYLFLSATAAGGGIKLPDAAYFQPKETKQLVQYIEDSAKADENYKKVVYPAKIAERDSIMDGLNPVDLIACDGCSLNDVKIYLKGKDEIEKKVIARLGHKDIAAAARISKKYSKFKTKYMPNQVLEGMAFVESRGRPDVESGKDCYGITGMSIKNAKKLGMDPKNPYSNIKMADSLYAENGAMLDDDGWQCIVAHALGGPNTKKIMEESGGKETYPDFKSSNAYRRFFRSGDEDRKALRNYVENISVGYDIATNPLKYNKIIDDRDKNKVKCKKHKTVMLAQR